MTQPHVDRRWLHQLYEEFDDLWTRLQALYLDAVAGFGFVRKSVEDEQSQARRFVQGSECDSEVFQDTKTFTYDEIFPGGFCTSGIHRATQGEVKRRNSPAGDNFNTLAQLCVISFYDFWNDYLRREYVIAKGYLNPNEAGTDAVRNCLRKNASSDLWGDLYYYRTSIVHHRGIAKSDISKCKLFKWFKPGDLIALTPENGNFHVTPQIQK